MPNKRITIRDIGEIENALSKLYIEYKFNMDKIDKKLANQDRSSNTDLEFTKTIIHTKIDMLEWVTGVENKIV